jgi:hypothetical protein
MPQIFVIASYRQYGQQSTARPQPSAGRVGISPRLPGNGHARGSTRASTTRESPIMLGPDQSADLRDPRIISKPHLGIRSLVFDRNRQCAVFSGIDGSFAARTPGLRASDPDSARALELGSGAEKYAAFQVSLGCHAGDQPMIVGLSAPRANRHHRASSPFPAEPELLQNGEPSGCLLALERERESLARALRARPAGSDPRSTSSISTRSTRPAWRRERGTPRLPAAIFVLIVEAFESGDLPRLRFRR